MLDDGVAVVGEDIPILYLSCESSIDRPNRGENNNNNKNKNNNNGCRELTTCTRAYFFICRRMHAAYACVA